MTDFDMWDTTKWSCYKINGEWLVFAPGDYEVRYRYHSWDEIHRPTPQPAWANETVCSCGEGYYRGQPNDLGYILHVEKACAL